MNERREERQNRTGSAEGHMLLSLNIWTQFQMVECHQIWILNFSEMSRRMTWHKATETVYWYCPKKKTYSILLLFVCLKTLRFCATDDVLVWFFDFVVYKNFFRSTLFLHLMLLLHTLINRPRTKKNLIFLAVYMFSSMFFYFYRLWFVIWSWRWNSIDMKVAFGSFILYWLLHHEYECVCVYVLLFDFSYTLCVRRGSLYRSTLISIKWMMCHKTSILMWTRRNGMNVTKFSKSIVC